MDEVTIDKMGNVIGIRAGDGPAVMVAAHMDEIGCMVSHIDDEGFLRVVPVGGWSDQTILGQRVLISTVDGRRIPGVVGSRPPHLMDAEERKKIVKFKDMFVDCGATSAAAAAAARRRDRLARPPSTASFWPFGHDLVTGKALDNRAGCAMMVTALKLLKGKQVRATIQAVGTVQEEVGLKGARTSAYGLAPDVAIATDVTIPGRPSGRDQERIARVRRQRPGHHNHRRGRSGGHRSPPGDALAQRVGGEGLHPLPARGGQWRQHRRDSHKHQQDRHSLQRDQRTDALHPLAGGGPVAARPRAGRRADRGGHRVGAQVLLAACPRGPGAAAPPPPYSLAFRARSARCQADASVCRSARHGRRHPPPHPNILVSVLELHGAPLPHPGQQLAGRVGHGQVDLAPQIGQDGAHHVPQFRRCRRR